MRERYRSFDEAFFSRKEIRRSLRYVHERHPVERNEPPAGEFSYAEFCSEAPNIIPRMFRAIRNGDFLLGPARPCVIIADKARIIQRFEWHDRFIISHLGRILHEWTLSILPDCLFSYRPGRSNWIALDRLSRTIAGSTETLFILRRDVSKYGENMQHRVLLETFRRCTSASSEIETLFRQVCAFSIAEEGETRSNERGLPTGTFIQVVCENLYLLDLDSEIASLPDTEYIRFGDDILAATKSRDAAITAAQRIAEKSTELGLPLNTDKSRDLLLVRPEEYGRATPPDGFTACTEFEYLGMKLAFDGALRLSHSKLEEARQFIKVRLLSLSRLLPEHLPERMRLSTLCSGAAKLLTSPDLFRANPTREYLLLTKDPAEIAAFDRWLALTILKLALRRGFKRGVFRSYPPRTLRALGLPSIAHLKRTHAL